MSYDGATLPFQAYAYYGTWSIDFGPTFKKSLYLNQNLRSIFYANLITNPKVLLD